MDFPPPVLPAILPAPSPTNSVPEPFQMPSEIPSVPSNSFHPSRPSEGISGTLAHGPLCVFCVYPSVPVPVICPCLVMVPPDEEPFLPHLCIITTMWHRVFVG